MKKIILAAVTILALGMGTVSATNPLDAIKSAIGNAVATDKFDINDLVGTWSYQSPAVSFQSDDALKKMGGAAAATVAEEKIAPYYQRLGLNRTTLTVDKDLKFVMKSGLTTTRGDILKNEDGTLTFNFTVLGKSLGKVHAHATKVGKTLNLTFDASKLIKVLTAVANKTQSTSLTSLSKIMGAYDGIYMGYKLTQTSSNGDTTEPATKTGTTQTGRTQSSSASDKAARAKAILNAISKKK